MVADARRWLRFIQFEPFTRAWRDLELGDEDLRWLELGIIAEPKAGKLVPGTGGLRKLRFSPPRWNTGKSGGVRVGYWYLENRGIVCLLAAYDHRQKADLSPAERGAIRALIERISELLGEE